MTSIENADGDPATRRKVAILGGGQAALTAALQLTDPRNPASRDLDVTIYQLGWRLGGKGATGRPTPPDVPRILEHGLHNWFGFYDNAFRQMREVYAELDRPPDAPLATFDEAFEPANAGAYVEWIEGQPLLWEIVNTPNSAKPGEGGLWLTPLEYVAEAIEMLERAFERSPLAGHGAEHDHLLARAHELLRGAAHEHPRELVSAHKAHDLLRLAAALARGAADVEGAAAVRLDAAHVDHVMRTLEADLPHDVELPHWIRELEDVLLRPLCWILWLFMVVLWQAVRRDISTPARTAERRLWITANLAYACITGAIRDDVVGDGFDVINDVDLRAWLGRHCYPDGGVMLRSPLVEAVYCGSFAYPAGQTAGGLDNPPAENMEAGTALRGIVRTLLTYKGSFAYRFAAGTADTCYAPTYEVLRRRGVAVRFFSRVDRLELEDGAIVRIHVAEQARIVGDVAYEPLFDVHELPCWPIHPLWEQLVDGEVFEACDADFEWPSPEVAAHERPYVLELGEDFDDVVLGISIAALPAICGDLVAAYPAWGAALEQVRTVRTQSLQIWLSKTTAQLGFELPGRPITNWRYDLWSTLDVWGDFSELIAMEHWPAERMPSSLQYFCSTMPEHPAFSDQRAANERARENAAGMLQAGFPWLAPGVLDDGGAVHWDLLVQGGDAGDAPRGRERLRGQWSRGNVTPTERYVLSVVGSSRHRLAVHDAGGPHNLYLAGDWTQCTLNCGCMEAATISGMLCSNALSGFPARAAIVGLDF
jgi:uncharacterized protein with NAD-binding domain and iron-sulfur cluster